MQTWSTCSAHGSTAASSRCSASTGARPRWCWKKLMQYEAVHEIQGWQDLRRRLESDRRCFAFFHPALPDEPIIFIEVALTKGMSDRVQPLLDPDSPVVDPSRRGRRHFLFHHQLPGRPARHLFRQFPDQASGGGSRSRIPAAQDFRHALACSRIP